MPALVFRIYSLQFICFHLLPKAATDEWLHRLGVNLFSCLAKPLEA
jgi:hypothetical protein